MKIIKDRIVEGIRSYEMLPCSGEDRHGPIR